jgi:hypothetical protein
MKNSQRAPPRWTLCGLMWALPAHVWDQSNLPFPENVSTSRASVGHSLEGKKETLGQSPSLPTVSLGWLSLRASSFLPSTTFFQFFDERCGCGWARRPSCASSSLNAFCFWPFFSSFFSFFFYYNVSERREKGDLGGGRERTRQREGEGTRERTQSKQGKKKRGRKRC